MGSGGMGMSQGGWQGMPNGLVEASEDDKFFMKLAPYIKAMEQKMEEVKLIWYIAWQIAHFSS